MPSSGSSPGQFEGFPVAAFDFYDDLEIENTKAFWTAHKQVYDEAVRAPMTALTDALTDEFGAARLFRPNRDVRFAADKSPYKTHQGAYVAVGPATGWYAQIAASGFRTGAGCYDAPAATLARIRATIADDRTGPEFEKLVRSMERKGYVLGGEKLKTAPRGYSVDHPRIELLRHKSFTLGRDYGFDGVVHTPDLASAVRSDWRSLRPFVEWLAACVGP